MREKRVVIHLQGDLAYPLQDFIVLKVCGRYYKQEDYNTRGAEYAYLYDHKTYNTK